MKVNYEPNPSSAIIIKRKKGLSVSNQQLKVNIFCWSFQRIIRIKPAEDSKDPFLQTNGKSRIQPMIDFFFPARRLFPSL